MDVNKVIIGLSFSLLLGNGIAVAADAGKVTETYVSGDYKPTLPEWTQLAEQRYVDIQARAWVGLRQQARVKLPQINEAIAVVDQMLNVLNAITTEGWSTKMALSFTDTFGITPPRVGEFDNLSYYLSHGLASTAFGVSVTESALQLQAQLQPSLSKAKGVNLRILKRAKAILEYRKALRHKALTSENYKEYDEYLMNTPAPIWGQV